MKIHRFLADFDHNQPEIALLDRELIHQWQNVLRLKPGDTVAIFNNSGHEIVGLIKKLDKGQAVVSVVEEISADNHPKRQVNLYAAILKRENFELVVQKATEIGVYQIYPIITERTVKTGLKKDRLEKIIKEATEQSGQISLPTLHESAKFTECLEVSGSNFLLDRTGSMVSNQWPLSEVNIFIGPEGGFTKSEIEMACDNGFQICSLGPTTLRAETAAVICSYLAVWA